MSLEHLKKENREKYLEELLGEALDYAEARREACLEQDKYKRERLLESAADDFRSDVEHWMLNPLTTTSYQAGVKDTLDAVDAWSEHAQESHINRKWVKDKLSALKNN